MAKAHKSAMYKTAHAGAKHGTPMKKGGAHQAPVAHHSPNAERRGTAKSGKKLTAM